MAYSYLYNQHSRYTVGRPSPRCFAWTSRASSVAPQSLQKKKRLFPQLSRCLSRACRGKSIFFIVRMAQKRRFPHRRSQRGSQCHRTHRSPPGTACGCQSRGSNGCSRRSSTWQTTIKQERNQVLSQARISPRPPANRLPTSVCPCCCDKREVQFERNAFRAAVRTHPMASTICPYVPPDSWPPCVQLSSDALFRPKGISAVRVGK